MKTIKREEFEEALEIELEKMEERHRKLGRPVTTDDTRKRAFQKLVDAVHSAKTSESTQTDH